MKVRHRKNQLNYQPKENQVKCTCCTRYYHTWDSDQGHSCASYIYLLHEINPEVEEKSYISCQYGSGYDTSRFDILDTRVITPTHIRGNRTRKSREDQYGRCSDRDLLICDSCIAKYLKKGWIVEDREYNPFQAIEELAAFYQEDPETYFRIMKDSTPQNCIQLIREAKQQKNQEKLE